MKKIYLFGFALIISHLSFSQTNPLWTEQKVKNYLPHMTVPEVEAFLEKSDIVIIPIAAIEQHGLHLPLGTDFLNGVERSKLIAQQVDVLVAPILLPGQSPYHMGFAGTISLKAETIVQVHFEAVQSLIAHGFKRFLIMNAHGGNRAITTFLVDKINQETAGIAVDLGEAVGPFTERNSGQRSENSGPRVFDRHGGVSETSSSLYLTPSLIDMKTAKTAELTMPDHLNRLIPEVLENDPTALLLLLAEGLKAEETGKGTSARQMSTTGVWGIRNIQEASVEQGRIGTERFVNAAVRFINKWNEWRPLVDESANKK